MPRSALKRDERIKNFPVVLAVLLLGGPDGTVGQKCWYPTQAERIKVIDSHCEFLKNNYVGWSLKKDRKIADGEMLCARALQQEREVSDPKESSNTPASDKRECLVYLEFAERVKKLASSFQDSHLSIRPGFPRTPVLLPIEFKWVQNKVYISAIDTRLVKTLRVGDEVISIDGVGVNAKIDELLPSIEASSALERTWDAVNALSARNFQTPTRGQTEINARASNTNETKTESIQWMFKGVPGKAERILFDEYGIQDIKALTGSDGLRLEGNTPETYFKEKDSEFRETVTGRDFNNDSIFLRFGHAKVEEQELSVLQILRLSLGKVTLQNHLRWGEVTSETTSADLAIDQVVISAKRAKNPLVIDLRNNVGGDLELATRLVSRLSSPKGRVIPLSVALPTSIYTRIAEENELTYRRNSGKRFALGRPELLINLVEEALAAQPPRPLTAWTPLELPPPDPEGWNSTVPIIVLTGPLCVSACEMAVRMLKTLPYVTTVGQPTAGTGFGSFEFARLAPRYRDPWQVLETKISVFAFSGTGSTGEGVENCVENQPFLPDVEYSSTIEDLVRGDSSWLKKAASMISRRHSLTFSK